MNRSEQINELAAALAKAQLAMTNPKKTSANPFFKSRYADLAEVIGASKKILAEHGLSIIQLPSLENNNLLMLETILAHESGQYISGVLLMPVMKMDAQGIGSACTYARRYAWAAICGLAQEDDDGNAASIPVIEAPKKTTKPSLPDQYLTALAEIQTIEELNQLLKIMPEELQKKLHDEIQRLKTKINIETGQNNDNQ